MACVRQTSKRKFCPVSDQWITTCRCALVEKRREEKRREEKRREEKRREEKRREEKRREERRKEQCIASMLHEAQQDYICLDKWRNRAWC